MKFYKKRLYSLEDLRREKRALKKAVKETGNGILHPFSGGNDEPAQPKKKKSTQSDEAEQASGSIDFIGLATNFISTNPMISAILLPVVKKYGFQAGKAGAKVGYKILKEVVIGYLKWKAIELSVKGAAQLVKNQKEKKKRKRAQA
jgi:hypothetical protein